MVCRSFFNMISLALIQLDPITVMCLCYYKVRLYFVERVKIGEIIARLKIDIKQIIGYQFFDMFLGKYLTISSFLVYLWHFRALWCTLVLQQLKFVILLWICGSLMQNSSTALSVSYGCVGKCYCCPKKSSPKFLKWNISFNWNRTKWTQAFLT